MKINQKKNLLKKKAKLNKNNYSSKISEKIDKTTKTQAKKIKEDGFGSQFSSLMFDNTDGPVGINQSNFIKTENFNGFDISLQRDLDFKNDYSEFGDTEMFYNVVSKDELMSSNMQ